MYNTLSKKEDETDPISSSPTELCRFLASATRVVVFRTARIVILGLRCGLDYSRLVSRVRHAPHLLWVGLTLIHAVTNDLSQQSHSLFLVFDYLTVTHYRSHESSVIDKWVLDTIFDNSVVGVALLAGVRSVRFSLTEYGYHSEIVTV